VRERERGGGRSSGGGVEDRSSGETKRGGESEGARLAIDWTVTMWTGSVIHGGP
jgi:hypothetical protein